MKATNQGTKPCPMHHREGPVIVVLAVDRVGSLGPYPLTPGAKIVTEPSFMCLYVLLGRWLVWLAVWTAPPTGPVTAERERSTAPELH